MLATLTQLFTRQAANEAVDTLLVTFSDMHSGGSTSLFLPHQFLDDEHQQPVPNKRQKQIYQVFERAMDEIAAARQGKRLVIAHNGDAIEGIHHNSTQAVLFSTTSQAKVHVELMQTLMARVGFDKSKGDRIFYVRGTETHVHDVENEIARLLGADQVADGVYVHDHLALNVNGRWVWYVHHGPKRGKGANQGNALRNWLRDIYWDNKKVGKQQPDLVFTGHVHTADYNAYIMRDGNGFHTMWGVICPSWQSKTRFAYKVASVELNEVGAVYVDISAAGDIRTPQFVLEEMPSENAVFVV